MKIREERRGQNITLYIFFFLIKNNIHGHLQFAKKMCIMEMSSDIQEVLLKKVQIKIFHAYFPR